MMAFNMAKAITANKRLHEQYGTTEIGIKIGDKPYRTVGEWLNTARHWHFRKYDYDVDGQCSLFM